MDPARSLKRAFFDNSMLQRRINSLARAPFLNLSEKNMKLNIPMLLLGCLAAPGLFAANVRLDSYSIEKKQLAAPLTARDAAGAEHNFKAVYLVKVKGVVPTNHALPVQLFVGEYAIREYGATRDGIYFKVYDPLVLRQMHGKPFRYAAEAKAARQTALIFKAPAE